MPDSEMDLQLIELISQLNHSQKEALIFFSKELLQAEGSSDRQSIAEYNLELDQAMERVRKGEFTSLEDLEKEMKSW
jgi:hypothetical protein